MIVRLFVIVVGALLLWFTTGSLSPYAATLVNPISSGSCHYLYNTDHPLFQATFLMLEGAPAEFWSHSIVLRRILYPVLAFPFMKFFGFELGGVVTNFTVLICVSVYFCNWVEKRFNAATAFVTALVLSVHPGIAYWIGLPYSYALIVPGSLLSVILLVRLEASDKVADIVKNALALGLLGLIHDSLALFPALAAVVLLGMKRRIRLGLLAGLLTVVPLIATQLAISTLTAQPSVNSNTTYYFAIIETYFSQFSLQILLDRVLVLPQEALAIFLFSQFAGFGLLILVVAGGIWINRRRFGGSTISKLDVSWLTSFLIVFLVINISPMEGMRFTLRGSAYSRFYQVGFAPLLLWFSAAYYRADRRALHSFSKLIQLSVGGLVAFNIAIILGPWVYPQLSGWTYVQFYGHGPVDQFAKNIARYGAHPLGFDGCPVIPPPVPFDKEYMEGAAKL